MGDLDAESLLAELRDMGIDVDCSAEQLTLLARCRANSRMLSCMLALLHVCDVKCARLAEAGDSLLAP